MDLLPSQRLQLGQASVGCELSRPGCLGCPAPNPAPAPSLPLQSLLGRILALQIPMGMSIHSV